MLVLKEPEVDVVGYALDVDEFNIILYKLTVGKSGKGAGEVRRLALGYYNSVEACLQRIYMNEVTSQGLSDLEALNTAVQATIGECCSKLGSFQHMYRQMNSGG